MFDITHGIGMFFIGCTVTFIGFFIAYMVASNVAMNKKPKELSDVEKSLKDLGYGEDCQ